MAVLATAMPWVKQHPTDSYTVRIVMLTFEGNCPDDRYRVVVFCKDQFAESAEDFARKFLDILHRKAGSHKNNSNVGALILRYEWNAQVTARKLVYKSITPVDGAYPLAQKDKEVLWALFDESMRS